MWLHYFFLSITIVSCAMCIRVYDDTDSQIIRIPPKTDQNDRNTTRANAPRSIKGAKNQKESVVHSNTEIDVPSDSQQTEKPEQSKSNDEQKKGLSTWLNALHSNRELPFDGDRVQFHIQGHKGPNSYIFGFDTGHGKNRQFRLEEKSEDGIITGQYGYYDFKGKLKRVKYVAKPLAGYEEKHHESKAQ